VSHRLKDGLMITAEGVHLHSDHHRMSGWQCRRHKHYIHSNVQKTVDKVCRYVQQGDLRLAMLTAGLMGLVTSEALDLDSISSV